MGVVLAVGVGGELEELAWPAGGELGVLQQAVGGYVDAVTLRADLVMWCNDEGMLNGSLVNLVASLMASAFGPGQPFFGPVVFTGGTDDEGVTLSLSDEQLRGLRIACTSIRSDLGGAL